MQTRQLKLADISRDDCFNFTFPSHPERYVGMTEKFPGLPLLIVDGMQKVVCGHDYLKLLRRSGATETAVLQVDIDATSALFLNFNLMNRLFGLNLYEKLLFSKKISRLCSRQEIQRRADLDFSLNDALLQYLDLLLSEPFCQALASGNLDLKTAMKLTALVENDRLAVLGLFQEVRFSENQQMQLIQLLEESAFREKVPFTAILAEIGLNGLMVFEMPQKKILAALQSWRHPAYARMQSEWRQWRKKMTVANDLELVHTPLFENEEIRITLTAKNRKEAERLLKKLK